MATRCYVTLQTCGGAAARVVASLRHCNGVVAMAGRADELLCSDGGPGRWLRCFAAITRRVDDYAALQRWHAGATAMLLCSGGT